MKVVLFGFLLRIGWLCDNVWQLSWTDEVDLYPRKARIQADIQLKSENTDKQNFSGGMFHKKKISNSVDYLLVSVFVSSH